MQIFSRERCNNIVFLQWVYYEFRNCVCLLSWVACFHFLFTEKDITKTHKSLTALELIRSDVIEDRDIECIGKTCADLEIIETGVAAFLDYFFLYLARKRRLQSWKWLQWPSFWLNFPTKGRLVFQALRTALNSPMKIYFCDFAGNTAVSFHYTFRYTVACFSPRFRKISFEKQNALKIRIFFCIWYFHYSISQVTRNF